MRVDADELRCRVIGEGGNLGVTQRGRIQFASAGGRINTDAIDNSGGVDCSDHEVNLKILLSQAVGDGDMTRKQRDQLLDGDGRRGVCAGPGQQRRAERDAHRGGHAGARDGRGPSTTDGGPDPSSRISTASSSRCRAMPSWTHGRSHDRGLTRPELAVLLAFTKNLLAEDLVVVAAAVRSHLRRATRCRTSRARSESTSPSLALRHPLRTELVATVVANQLVNRGGISMVHRLMGETSATAEDIARAYTAAWRIYDLDTAVVLDRRARRRGRLPRSGPSSSSTSSAWASEPRAGSCATRPSRIDIDAVVATYSGPVRVPARHRRRRRMTACRRRAGAGRGADPTGCPRGPRPAGQGHRARVRIPRAQPGGRKDRSAIWRPSRPSAAPSTISSSSGGCGRSSSICRGPTTGRPWREVRSATSSSANTPR